MSRSNAGPPVRAMPIAMTANFARRGTFAQAASAGFRPIILAVTMTIAPTIFAMKG